MAILQLIRWPNLLMMLLLQYLLRYCMAGPILELQQLGLLLTDSEFAIMSISCILIAAGGYIINDIEDIAIDRINKPEKQIIGTRITSGAGFNYYLLFTFAGILGGFYLTFVKEYKYIAYVNLVSAGLLYFYSTSYKCIPIVGNLIISLLSALLVFMVIMNEPFAREDQGVMLMIGTFMFFSFYTTFLREFIKDIEDEEGDLSADCQTFANLIGASKAKWVAVLLSAILVILIVLIQIVTQQWESPAPFIYIVLFIDIPLIYLTLLLTKASERRGYHTAGNWLKLAMFTATISLVVFYYNFK